MYLWAFTFKHSTFSNFAFKNRPFIESCNLLHSSEDVNAFNQLSGIGIKNIKYMSRSYAELTIWVIAILGKQTQRQHKSCPSRVSVEGWCRTEIHCCEPPYWPFLESPSCCGAQQSSRLEQENINEHSKCILNLFVEFFRGFKVESYLQRFFQRLTPLRCPFYQDKCLQMIQNHILFYCLRLELQ